MFVCLRTLISSFNSGSSPVIPVSVTFRPNAERFLATFEAPPGLYIVFFISTTGTGASGDILLTEPWLYLSNIISPMTRIFVFLNIINLC